MNYLILCVGEDVDGSGKAYWTVEWASMGAPAWIMDCPDLAEDWRETIPDPSKPGWAIGEVDPATNAVAWQRIASTVPPMGADVHGISDEADIDIPGITERRPDTMGGKAVFVGTRTPMGAVVPYLERGMSDEGIHEAFPHLAIEAIAAARSASAGTRKPRSANVLPSAIVDVRDIVQAQGRMVATIATDYEGTVKIGDVIKTRDGLWLRVVGISTGPTCAGCISVVVEFLPEPLRSGQHGEGSRP